MNELQTLESIIKNAPDDMWTHCNDINYFRHIKQHSWLIYNDVSGCWQQMKSTGIIHEKNIRNKKDIQKQIDQSRQLKAIAEDRDYFQEIAIKRLNEIWRLREQLASAKEDGVNEFISHIRNNAGCFDASDCDLLEEIQIDQLEGKG